MHTSQTNRKEKKICDRCSYDANPTSAKYCQKCGNLLNTVVSEKKDKTTTTNFEFPYFWSVLASLFVLFGLGGYFLSQHILPKPEIRDRASSSNTNISGTFNSSDIQSYKTMKEVPNVPPGTFRYGGSLLFASLVAQGTHKSIDLAHPQFTLRYVEPPNHPGSGAGIEMLLNGQVHFAFSARPVEDAEYQKAIERSFKLDQVAIAIDALAFYTHPDISIPGLSISQLQDIYTGKITNWKEVGGSNLPIIAFSTNPKSTSSLKTLLGAKVNNLSTRVKSRRDYTTLVREVATTPGAIGMGYAAIAASQRKVRPVAIARGNQPYVPYVIDGNKLNVAAFRDESYPLTRYLYVIIRRNGRTDEKAGVAYANLLLSKEGQQFVEKAGLVPISP